jgi:hypothetical protein
MDFATLMKQLEASFAQPIGMGIAIVASGGMVLLILRVAMTPERRAGWVRLITSRNGRWAFLFLLLAWAGTMALITFLPEGAHGSLQLIGMLAGFFLFMGFTWAVIGE